MARSGAPWTLECAASCNAPDRAHSCKQSTRRVPPAFDARGARSHVAPGRVASRQPCCHRNKSQLVAAIRARQESLGSRRTSKGLAGAATKETSDVCDTKRARTIGRTLPSGGLVRLRWVHGFAGRTVPDTLRAGSDARSWRRVSGPRAIEARMLLAARRRCADGSRRRGRTGGEPVDETRMNPLHQPTFDGRSAPVQPDRERCFGRARIGDGRTAVSSGRARPAAIRFPSSPWQSKAEQRSCCRDPPQNSLSAVRSTGNKRYPHNRSSGSSFFEGPCPSRTCGSRGVAYVG